MDVNLTYRTNNQEAPRDVLLLTKPVTKRDKQNVEPTAREGPT